MSDPTEPPVNMPFERIPQSADDPGFGPTPFYSIEKQINEIVCEVEARRLIAPEGTKRILKIIRRLILRTKP